MCLSFLQGLRQLLHLPLKHSHAPFQRSRHSRLLLDHSALLLLLLRYMLLLLRQLLLQIIDASCEALLLLCQQLAEAACELAHKGAVICAVLHNLQPHVRRAFVVLCDIKAVSHTLSLLADT
jgi:hypothetical protein